MAGVDFRASRRSGWTRDERLAGRQTSGWLSQYLAKDRSTCAEASCWKRRAAMPLRGPA